MERQSARLVVLLLRSRQTNFASYPLVKQHQCKFRPPGKQQTAARKKVEFCAILGSPGASSDYKKAFASEKCRFTTKCFHRLSTAKAVIPKRLGAIVRCTVTGKPSVLLVERA